MYSHCVLLILYFGVTYTTTDTLQHTKRIIGGTNTTAYQCPFYAMLYYGGFHSGGIIIDRNVILTAASVVDGFKDEDMEIFVGTSSIGDTLVTFPRDNNKTIKHPLYKHGSADYDCALMFLVDDIGFGGKIEKINLSRNAAPVNSRVSLCGFGYPKCNGTTSNGRCKGVASKTLLRADFLVKGYTGRNTMYTTGVNRTSSCFGDFGGPIFHNNQLYGIASLIQNANCTGYNLITSIPGVRSWIEETIKVEHARRNQTKT